MFNILIFIWKLIRLFHTAVHLCRISVQISWWTGTQHTFQKLVTCNSKPIIVTLKKVQELKRILIKNELIFLKLSRFSSESFLPFRKEMAVLFLKLQTWNSNSFVLFDLYSGAGRGSRMHFMRLLLALTSPLLLAWCASLLWMILDGHKLRPKFLLIFGAHRCTKSKVHNCREVEQK